MIISTIHYSQTQMEIPYTIDYSIEAKNKLHKNAKQNPQR